MEGPQAEHGGKTRHLNCFAVDIFMYITPAEPTVSEMETLIKPAYRHQLFDATIRILETARCFGPDVPLDAASLEYGIHALHDTLLLSWREDASLLTPFYLVCLELCHGFLHSIRSDPDFPGLEQISVSGYRLCQLIPVLLSLFHALRTFVVFICCVPFSSSEDTKKRCLSCVARAIHDLEKHKSHLESLADSEAILLQRYVTTSCLMMGLNCLCAVGIDSCGNCFCECIRHGSNRMHLRLDDIASTRFGNNAMEHFASLGEPLLEEISRRRDLEDDRIWQDLTDRYQDLETRFRAAIECLGHEYILVSREIITRGNRLEFGVTATANSVPSPQ
ncbi:unnamed protein product [Penicillium pancosmium]